MTERHDELHRQLDALPDIPLPDALWLRVDACRRMQQRRRKAGAGVAIAALAALMVAIPVLHIGDPAPAQRGQSVVTRSTQATSSAASPRDIDAQLRALDQALQAAYARSATDAEIAPMWVARNALTATAQAGESLSRHKKI